ncbi:MAG: hypothetical protein NTW86_21900 [Candidatus Sumerlaeota bacterium]|nr:hypothetical protein [Candidatus Sumerlaeota bacterium]
MRPLWFAALLLIVAYVFLFAYRVNKMSRLLAQSTALMDKDVNGAIALFKPALDIKNYDTLGQASTYKHRFYVDLAKSIEHRLEQSVFSDTDADNVFAALDAVNRSKQLSASECVDEHGRIVQKAQAMQQRMANQGLLPDFDAYTRFLQKFKGRTALVAGREVDFEPIAAAALKVDRYPVALRTVLFNMRADLDLGFRCLKLDSPGEGKSAEAPVTANVGTWIPGEAEAAFRRAWQAPDKFVEEWKTPPTEELKRLQAAATFDVAMTRMAHALLTLRAGGEWKFYLLPGVQPAMDATEQEVRIVYMQDMYNFFQMAIEKAEALAPTDPYRTAIAKAAHYAQAIANAQIAKDRPGAASEMAAYRQLAPDEPINAPPECGMRNERQQPRVVRGLGRGSSCCSFRIPHSAFRIIDTWPSSPCPSPRSGGPGRARGSGGAPTAA